MKTEKEEKNYEEVIFSAFLDVENNHDLCQIKIKPSFWVLINSIWIQAWATTQQHEPVNQNKRV